MADRRQGRALWLPDIARDAGLDIIVEPGFEHRGRDPIRWVAQVNHHTASNRNGGVEPSRETVRDGRGGPSPVPGPLANTLPRRDGVIRMIASGAANHPGVSYLPHLGGISSGVKYYALGHEIELDGIGEPFPVSGRQYEAVSILNAAICIYLSHDPTRDLWDHKAIARPVGRKIDVHPYDLHDGRVRVARRMTGVPLPSTDWFDTMDKATLEAIFDAKLAPIRTAIGALAQKAIALRDPRSGRVYIISEAGRWWVRNRDALNLLLISGQVAPFRGQVPVADPDWLDGIPIIDEPVANVE